MSIIVNGIYDRGIVKLKTQVNVPDNTEVLVVFKEKADKKKFLKAAGTWKNIDNAIFDDILNSRTNLRTRNVKR